MRQLPVRILFMAVSLAVLASALPLAAAGPALLHPTGVEYITLPYFDWYDSVGSPYPGRYEIEIDRLDQPMLPMTATIPAVVSFYSPHQELEPGSYSWKLRYVDAAGNSEGWTPWQPFSIATAPTIVDVPNHATWDEIKSALSNATGDFVELRLFPNGTYNLYQTFYENPQEPSQYLFYFNNRNNVIINGQGAKILIHATQEKCGFFAAVKSQHLQIKDLTVDYADDSLSQYGGKIVAIENDENRDPVTNIPAGDSFAFTVEVDPNVYRNRAELGDVAEGFFVDAEHHQRIGRVGVRYTMDKTWLQARFVDNNGKTKYRFTACSGFGSYAGELKVGDYFVSTRRGGDLVYIDNDVTDVVVNDLNFNGSRGRYFVVHHNQGNDVPPEQLAPRSHFIRSISNKFLRTQGRILGSPSGGVNDKGSESWHENVTIESTRDDAFHTGVPVGEQNVLLNSVITGAFRHSAWIQADRSWVENNRIYYPGTEGITLGGGVDDEDDEDDNRGTDTQVSVGLIKDNRILSSRRSGIVSAPPFLPDHYNTDLTVIGNTVHDHQSGEAMHLEYLASSRVSDNKMEGTGIRLYPFAADWRIYAENPRGLYIAHSHGVTGTGNQLSDPRIPCSSRKVVDVDPNSGNSLPLSGLAKGAHESWNCAAPASFAGTATLAGDHLWTIHADNFPVDLLDAPRAFGLTSTQPSSSLVDKHTAPLSQPLFPAATALKMHARFYFNALTQAGRAEARFGVEDSSSGIFYEIGLNANQADVPIRLSAMSVSKNVPEVSAGTQTTDQSWDVFATFRRTGPASTDVDYVIQPPGDAAPYVGTTNLATAVPAGAMFDRIYLAFRQRAQVVFDSIEVAEVDLP